MEESQNYRQFLNFLKNQINSDMILSEEELLNNFSESNDYAEYNRKVFRDVYKLGYLDDFLNDPGINEIILHDHRNFQIEKNGKLISYKLNGILKEIYLISLETLALKNKVIWNFSNPFASFYTKFCDFPFRVSLIHESTGAQKKSKAFFRRIKNQPLSLKNFGIGDEDATELKKLVKDKKNILMAGQGGSGKSSLMSSLVEFIPECEHVIILEDTHEIIPSRLSFTSFLENSVLPNKSLKDFCGFSLRLRPDRLILGEIRSSEIIPFVLAMNTGHRGMMSTLHADSAVDSIYRMAILFQIHGNNQSVSFEMTLKLLCKNIDIVIFLKDKKIREIIKIIGTEKGVVNYDYLFKNNLS
jgi:Flp pilus assembly CpaF family ATPase